MHPNNGFTYPLRGMHLTLGTTTLGQQGEFILQMEMSFFILRLECTN